MWKTRSIRTIGVVSVLALLVAVATPYAKDAPESADSAADIRELLTARRDVLAQLVDVQRQRYMTGATGFESVARSRMELLNAELELASTAAERVATYESLLQMATELDQAVQQRYQAGEGGVNELLESKALRLKAEADLLKERLAIDGMK